MPPFETLLAMAGFALAASATPGSVNIIGAMTGARELASEARTRLRLGKGGYRREHVRAFAQHVEVATRSTSKETKTSC